MGTGSSWLGKGRSASYANIFMHIKASVGKGSSSILCIMYFAASVFEEEL